MERRMFWFDKEDDKALAKIMRQYRCETKSQAVRLALKMVADNSLTTPSERTIKAQDYRRRSTKPRKRKRQHILLRLAALAKHAPQDLPEDLSERFDDYRFAELRANL